VHTAMIPRHLLIVCMLMVIPVFPQESFHEKETVQAAIMALSKCLQSLRPGCVARSVSARGVTLGVDGPRISGKITSPEAASGSGHQMPIYKSPMQLVQYVLGICRDR
jgi:hypothetical protein